MRRFLCSTFLILLILITGIPKAEAATQHITVGVVANTPPYQFLDENGNCVGLHIDLMNELA